jgi:hypothetical protein
MTLLAEPRPVPDPISPWPHPWPTPNIRIGTQPQPGGGDGMPVPTPQPMPGPRPYRALRLTLSGAIFAAVLGAGLWTWIHAGPAGGIVVALAAVAFGLAPSKQAQRPARAGNESGPSTPANRSAGSPSALV